MPYRRSLNQSGPRNHSTSRMDPWQVPNNTVRVQRRIRRERLRAPSQETPELLGTAVSQASTQAAIRLSMPSSSLALSSNLSEIAVSEHSSTESVAPPICALEGTAATLGVCLSCLIAYFCYRDTCARRRIVTPMHETQAMAAWSHPEAEEDDGRA